MVLSKKCEKIKKGSESSFIKLLMFKSTPTDAVQNRLKLSYYNKNVFFSALNFFLITYKFSS